MRARISAPKSASSRPNNRRAMGEIISLKAGRKARARRADAAEANRARFGRTKAEKARDSAESAQRERRLDDARLERE